MVVVILGDVVVFVLVVIKVVFGGHGTGGGVLVSGCSHGSCFSSVGDFVSGGALGSVVSLGRCGCLDAVGVLTGGCLRSVGGAGSCGGRLCIAGDLGSVVHGGFLCVSGGFVGCVDLGVEVVVLVVVLVFSVVDGGGVGWQCC
jgi:hypothetical protein